MPPASTPRNWIASRGAGVPGGRRARACPASVLAEHIRAKTNDLRDVADFAVAVLRGDTVRLADYNLPPDGDKTITVRDKQWAVEWLADRGAGRAVESIQLQVPGDGDAAGLSDRELLAAFLRTLSPDELRGADVSALRLAAGAIDVESEP